MSLKTNSFYQQPLFHFVVLGALIFLFHSWFGDQQNANPERIIVTVPQVERMAGLWYKTWGRPPSDLELHGLVRDYIKEEIYYREAIKLGLDINDTVIRRRLRQKMEFMISPDLLSTPNDNDLSKFLNENTDEFIIKPSYSFKQVYFKSDQRGLALETQLLLNQADQNSNLLEIGSPISLPKSLDSATQRQIMRLFGQQFYDSLSTLTVDKWSEPIESGFGFHLINISMKTDTHIPPLSEIRQAVMNSWSATQRITAEENAFEKYLDQYDIQINSNSK